MYPVRSFLSMENKSPSKLGIPPTLVSNMDMSMAVGVTRSPKGHPSAKEGPALFSIFGMPLVESSDGLWEGGFLGRSDGTVPSVSTSITPGSHSAHNSLAA